MTNIIGVSGKIGSGKNYLANKLIEELASQGLVGGYGSFAASLKQELNDIVRTYRRYLGRNTVGTEAVAVEYKIPLNQAIELIGALEDDITANPHLDAAVDRSEGVRRGLQLLGTEIRRNVQPNYWIDRFWATLDHSLDYVFVTDTRFVNEADSIADNENGVVLRINASPEIVAARAVGRDGIQYSEEALNHTSETALDDYPRFDVVVGDTFNAQEVLWEINSKLSSKHHR